MDVKIAIERGDATALRRLLAEAPARANELIQWGKQCEIRTHPLHYISDMLFSGTLPHGAEMPLVEALLAAGADCNHQASNGETPLIGAASLHAVDVGVRLLEAGARPNTLGGGKETALHWAAYCGLRRLVNALLEYGADVHLKDARYHATPLGWAMEGRFHTPAGRTGEYAEVATALVTAGAIVEPAWLEDDQVRSDPAFLAALTAR